LALLPVLSADVDGARLMQQDGVDYSKLECRGATALQVTKGIGNSALIDVLKRGRSYSDGSTFEPDLRPEAI
jgi:hypothetical protein